MKPHPAISCRALLRRSALKIAALLLVLHWAVPSPREFQPVPPTGPTTPIYEPADLGIYRGTLPRALARVQTFENGLPKTLRDTWLSAGKLATLALADRVQSFPPLENELSERPAPRVATRAAAFHARGPPVL